MSKRNRKGGVRPSVQEAVLAKVEIGVVIPVYGQTDLLQKSLVAIPAAVGNYSYRIVLVDNGSPKEDVAEFYNNILPSLDLPVSVIRLVSNAGFPRACNVGIRNMNCEYVAVVTSDVEMSPGSLELMVNDCKADETVGIVGPKLIFSEGTPHGPAGKIQHAGMNFSIRGTIDHTFIGWSANNPKANKLEYVDAVTGACFVTPKKLMIRAGLFDEHYGLGTWEDIDYCMSVHDLGYNILYEPKAVGTHWVGASVTHYKMQFPLEQNRNRFLSKWQGKIMWTVWKRL